MPATIRAVSNYQQCVNSRAGNPLALRSISRTGAADLRPLAQTFVARFPNGGETMTPFVLRSSLDASHRGALERLMYFNPRQHEAEIGIAGVVDAYGAPIIVDDAAGLHVTVGRRPDAQCLFALASTTAGLTLAGMIVFLRISIEEMLVLHVAVADGFGRNRRLSLAVVMALVGSVREAAHRLRGTRRFRMLYVPGSRIPAGDARSAAGAAG
jgi:hypothetical protein